MKPIPPLFRIRLRTSTGQIAWVTMPGHINNLIDAKQAYIGYKPVLGWEKAGFSFFGATQPTTNRSPA